MQLGVSRQRATLVIGMPSIGQSVVVDHICNQPLRMGGIHTCPPHEVDSNRQFDLAMQAKTRMNGLAVSSGQPGLIEMTHLVAYDSENNRTVAIPLKLVITVTNLGGLGPTKPAAMDLSRIRPKSLPRLATLMD